MRFDFESIVEPSVTANGCDLWGIDFIHGANTPILRVFIDAVGGATIEDCEKISKDLNYELPLDNFFAELDYTLEVSTPGVERKIFKAEQFDQFVGEKFSIKLKVPVEGKLTFKLIYKKFDSNLIFLDQDNNEYKFAFEDIDTCKLIPDFEKILRKENG